MVEKGSKNFRDDSFKVEVLNAESEGADRLTGRRRELAGQE